MRYRYQRTLAIYELSANISLIKSLLFRIRKHREVHNVIVFYHFILELFYQFLLKIIQDINLKNKL